MSRASAPKQFAKTVGDKSFLELTVARLLRVVKPTDLYIATGDGFRNELLELIPQVPESNFILEPQMKDTGIAAANAAKALFKTAPDEPFGIFWSDHMVRDEDTFKSGFEIACEKVKATGKMVYYEVPIRFADVNRGYVELGRKIEDYGEKTTLYQFVRFLEKPSLEKAQHYYDNQENYACNTGYLIATPRILLDKYKKYCPEIHDVLSSPIREAFDKAPKMSFDYAVAEKLQPNEVLVLKADFGYFDMGEWITIKQAYEKSAGDNVLLAGVAEFIDAKDSLVYGQNDKLVALIGTKGVGVIDTKDALLVLNLKDSNRVKELVKRLKEKGLGKYV